MLLSERGLTEYNNYYNIYKNSIFKINTKFSSKCLISVQFSCSVVSNSL